MNLKLNLVITKAIAELKSKVMNTVVTPCSGKASGAETRVSAG